ncbi:hypothetical protein BwSH20_76330 [Bradyrhizobium ottawaense]|nr:hypothetical protein SG09_26940 [Bradyrhizobium ottawaense]GMO10804.1 hypothetical protein BwSH12_77070 [Bradyrhizobium ottawaense]GMO10907.1 hypothetical protein BwSH20_76330 [Bradyrhizobium ottawaense]GMO39197.1 hypothetical protein BwSH14_48980 [Bradyrhizobium ottawaense]GMO52017.1 hypothetical protein BwSF21_75320 [Bradyrhizobium ottawaense]
MPQRSEHRGDARSLTEANARFRTAWDDLQAQINYDQLKQAREIQGRRRPWHR